MISKRIIAGVLLFGSEQFQEEFDKLAKEYINKKYFGK